MNEVTFGGAGVPLNGILAFPFPHDAISVHKRMKSGCHGDNGAHTNDADNNVLALLVNTHLRSRDQTLSYGLWLCTQHLAYQQRIIHDVVPTEEERVVVHCRIEDELAMGAHV